MSSQPCTQHVGIPDALTGDLVVQLAINYGFNLFVHGVVAAQLNHSSPNGKTRLTAKDRIPRVGYR